MNLAIADAIIVCWDAKYYYEFWRPVTAISLADTDGNDDTTADLSWTPLLVTPPHPEYTSGHSSASSAAATVLADYFGDETSFTVRSQTDLNWVRSFSSFSAAVAEVADARVFAGIHFRAACVVGTAVGADVAADIIENLIGRIHGSDN
jgi:membrane-associated phospholipid phosphatase